MLPGVDQVGGEVRDVDEVAGTVADDLIRDRDAAVSDVADIRAHGDKCPKIRCAPGR